MASTFSLYKEAQYAAEEVRLARAVTAGRTLDDTFVHPQRGVEINLRWVYIHMIEEYARHNGHADLLRALLARWICQKCSLIVTRSS